MDFSFSIQLDPTTVIATVVGLALIRPLVTLLVEHLKPASRNEHQQTDERGL